MKMFLHFSNRNGNEISLVIYNNSYSEAHGNITYSCERAYGEEGRTTTTSIDKALGINLGYGFYYIFKDFVQQLEYIISGSEIGSNGFLFHLMGYQRKVLLDFREVYDFDGKYKAINEHLNGRGVDSIERTLGEMNLAPLHNSLGHLFTSIKFSRLLLALDFSNEDYIELPEIDDEISRIYNDLSKIDKFSISADELLENIITDISIIRDFNNSLLEISSSKNGTKSINQTISFLWVEDDNKRKKDISFLLLNTILFRILNSLENNNSHENIFDKLMLWKPFFEISGFLKYDDPGKSYELSKTLFSTESFQIENNEAALSKSSKNNKQDYIQNYFHKLFESDMINKFLQVNDYAGIKYFNKERIEDYFRWNFILLVINNSGLKFRTKKNSVKQFTDTLKTFYKTYLNISDRINKSEYKVEKLLSISKTEVIKKEKQKTLKKETKISLKKKGVSFKKKKN